MDTMTIEQAEAIVNRYESIEREVEREYQERRVAAWNAMMTAEVKGPRSPAAVAYRELQAEQAETFKTRMADIHDDYPQAYAMVQEQRAADARGNAADAIGQAERIAY